MEIKFAFVDFIISKQKYLGLLNDKTDYSFNLCHLLQIFDFGGGIGELFWNDTRENLITTKFTTTNLF